MNKKIEATLTCPLPVLDFSSVQLSHGGGGRMTHRLIEDVFMPAFKNDFLEERHDGAVLDIKNARLAFTTDSYVVRPLFFPGGNIGMLAVNGTVNDLAMCGARPLYLSAGFILEEGLPAEVLELTVRSMKDAAENAGVRLVTGDTKVVDRGKGDGIFINTAGIGVIEHDQRISPRSLRAGDAILLNGDIGRHGMAIMAMREGIEFETAIQSDCAALSGLVQKLLEAGIRVHCMRDLTRGGLATAAVEIAESAGMNVQLDESSIPVCDGVQGACEILGLDPLYVANEGRFIAFVDPGDAERALAIMRLHPLGKDARVIGRVTEQKRGQGWTSQGKARVTLKTRIGVERIVDMLSGEQLPRIC